MNPRTDLSIMSPLRLRKPTRGLVMPSLRNSSPNPPSYRPSGDMFISKLFVETLLNNPRILGINKMPPSSADSLLYFIYLIMFAVFCCKFFLHAESNGDGVSREIHREEGIYAPKMIFWADEHQ